MENWLALFSGSSLWRCRLRADQPSFQSFPFPWGRLQSHHLFQQTLSHLWHLLLSRSRDTKPKLTENKLARGPDRYSSHWEKTWSRNSTRDHYSTWTRSQTTWTIPRVILYFYFLVQITRIIFFQYIKIDCRSSLSTNLRGKDVKSKKIQNCHRLSINSKHLAASSTRSTWYLISKKFVSLNIVNM